MNDFLYNVIAQFLEEHWICFIMKYFCAYRKRVKLVNLISNRAAVRFIVNSLWQLEEWCDVLVVWSDVPFLISNFIWAKLRQLTTRWKTCGLRRFRRILCWLSHERGMLNNIQRQWLGRQVWGGMKRIFFYRCGYDDIFLRHRFVSMTWCLLSEHSVTTTVQGT